MTELPDWIAAIWMIALGIFFVYALLSSRSLHKKGINSPEEKERRERHERQERIRFLLALVAYAHFGTNIDKKRVADELARLVREEGLGK